jgi:hypothetical protein
MQVTMRTIPACARSFMIAAILIVPAVAAPKQVKAVEYVEPANCILIGGGLIAISYIGRRKRPAGEM